MLYPFVGVCNEVVIFVRSIQTKEADTFRMVPIDKPDSSVRAIIEAKSVAQYGMECLNRAGGCIAFTYDALAVARFNLFKSITSIDSVGTKVFAVSVPVPITKRMA